MSGTRILLINYEFPPLGGGAGNATQNIARELATLGADTRVLTTRFGDQPAEETRDGFRIHRVQTPRKREDRSSPFEMLIFMLKARTAALKLTADWRPDACIAFFGIPGGPVALALKRHRAVPYIVSLRGGDVPGHQPDQLAALHALTKPLIRVVWRNAKALVANSEGLRALAETSAQGKTISVVPNGVDTTFFKPADSPPANTVPVLLYAGRISEEKGLGGLIAALKQNSALEWSLNIVGDGPFMPRLKQCVADAGLDDRVTYLGWQSRDHLVAHYQSADLFVFPSKHEGMSNSVLEAMACALPILATRIAGNEELVHDGETGLLVPSDTPDALASALNDLLIQPALRERFAAASRARAAANYSWATTAKHYLALVED